MILSILVQKIACCYCLDSQSKIYHKITKFLDNFAKLYIKVTYLVQKSVSTYT
uniref:Uncharacterized protein n=1 Tax=Arundo donax TaxID=35708 RepID=A0A0A9D647_ARUDO